jgi:hypothetical protein
MKIQIALALALPVLCLGCSADYLNHNDSVTLAQGDAVKSNIAIHTVDPFNPDSHNTRIEGDGRRLVGVVRAYRGSASSGNATNSKGRSDIDCKDVDGPVAITGSDPNRLDGDSDGIGCEQ